MRRGTPEGAVLRLVTDYLSAQKIWWMRLNTGAMSGAHKGKKWFVRFAKPGTADILAVTHSGWNKEPGAWLGVVHWIEVKAPKGKQSPDQKAFQQEVEAHGMKYLLVRSLDDLQKAGL